MRLHETIRRFLLAVFCLASVASGLPVQAAPLKPVVLHLKWHHQFQFAGYYAAKAQGYYEAEGLDVRFVEGGSGTSAIAEVVEGRSHYGVANVEALQRRLEGSPVVVLAAIFQHSPLVLVTPTSSGVTNPQDLKGQRVKFTRKKRDVELHAMFVNEGIALDAMEIVDAWTTREDYFDPSLKAVSAYLTNEPFYLRQKGIPFRVLRPINYGVDFYGDTLITSEAQIKADPKGVAAFRRASLKGWRYAMAHPEEMADLISRVYGAKKSRAHLLYEAEAMDTLILPKLVQMGHMNPGRWKRIAEILQRYGVVTDTSNFDGFLYDPTGANRLKLLKTGFQISMGVALALAIIALLLMWFAKRLQKEIHEKERVEAAHEALICDLKTALGEVKTLSGMLPICASCKKVRDDRGYWSQIESYLSEHSGAEFSHSYCPECEDEMIKHGSG